MSARHGIQFIDPSGAPAFDGVFLQACDFEGEVARVVSFDGRMQLIDTHGQRVGPSDLDFIEPFVNGFALANRGGSRASGRLRGGVWQLLDPSGQLHGAGIEAEAVLPVHDGHASVLAGGHWGFMNTRGELVVEPRYKFMGCHSEGLAVAAAGTGDVYIDHSGAVALAGPFEEATDFVAGLARVKVGGKWGIIDRSGAFVHAPSFAKIGAIVDGMAWASGEGGISILTAQGVLASELQNARLPADHAVAVCRGAVWSMLHLDGQRYGAFEDLLGLSEGLALAKKDGLWGYVDAKGSVRIAPQFEDALTFLNGFAGGTKNGVWRVVTEHGVVGPAHEHVSSGSEGLCSVKDEGLWGFVRADGSVAIPPQFTQVGRFSGSLAPVRRPSAMPATVLDSSAIGHVLPEDGLHHPVFAGSDAGSRIGAIIGFGKTLTGPEFEFANETLLAWSAECSPVFGWKDLTLGSLSLQVQAVAQPLLRLTTLIEQLRSVIPLTEVVFSRWEHPQGDVVAGPVRDPRSLDAEFGTFSTFQEYAEAAWSSSGPIPDCESAPNLKGAFVNRQDKMVLEQRGMPIWFPDVRVCFGALSASGEEYLADDERTVALHEALQGALDRRFGRVWSAAGRDRARPTVGTRAGEQGIERMTFGGRTGYSFAVDSSALLQWHAPSVCRYREPELLDAIRGVILEESLAPVLMWRRFQRALPGMPIGTPTVVVVNLWER